MSCQNRGIAQLPNLGPKSATILEKISIYTEEDLQNIGAVEAFLRLRAVGIQPSLNLLYAMEGALIGQKWNELDQDLKMELDFKVNFS